MTQKMSDLPRIVEAAVETIEEFHAEIAARDGATAIQKRLRRQRAPTRFDAHVLAPLDLAFAAYGLDTRSSGARQRRAAYEMWIGVPRGIRTDPIGPMPATTVSKPSWGIYGFLLLLRPPLDAGCVIALGHGTGTMGQLQERQRSFDQAHLSTPWRWLRPGQEPIPPMGAWGGLSGGPPLHPWLAGFEPNAALQPRLRPLPVRGIFLQVNESAMKGVELGLIIANALIGCDVLKGSEVPQVHRALKTWVLSEFGTDPAVSQDALDAIIPRVHRQLPTFQLPAPRSLQAYLRKAVVRETLVGALEISPTDEDGLALLPLADEQIGADEELIKATRHAHLPEALATLPNLEREVLELKFGLGAGGRELSNQDIGRRLGITTEAVEALVLRTTERMRARMEE
jgi:DNA-directed RNA polymerase specialized sigma24 family protein